MKTVLNIAFLLVILIVGGLMTWYGGSAVYRYLSTSGWQQVPAYVETVKWETGFILGNRRGTRKVQLKGYEATGTYR